MSASRLDVSAAWVAGVKPTEALATELGFVNVTTTKEERDGLRLVVTGVRQFGRQTASVKEVPKPGNGTEKE